MDSAVVEIAKAFKEGSLLRVLPCSTHEFTVKCVGGQLQLGIPACDGWDGAFETRVAGLATREGFRYARVYPATGCAEFLIFTNDTTNDIGKRTLRIISELLELTDEQPVWFEQETYAKAS